MKNTTRYICSITFQQRTFFHLLFFGSLKTSSAQRNSETFFRGRMYICSLLFHLYEPAERQRGRKDFKFLYLILISGQSTQNILYFTIKYMSIWASHTRFSFAMSVFLTVHLYNLFTIASMKYVIHSVEDQKGTLIYFICTKCFLYFLNFCLLSSK